MPTCVRSYSKINLGLAIGPLRSDGFHGLTTLYQTLAAHDLVTVSATRLGTGELSRITLASTDRRVPLDARNTVWKILERALALEPFHSHGWAVHAAIEKRLPVQGGLGGGSANAAAALVGLERETGLQLSRVDRLWIAAEVGSDVPLFLVGGAILGLGRGEEVYPMPDLERDGSTVEVVLALPSVGVSTPQAFEDWDALAAEDGKRDGAAVLTVPNASSRLGQLSRALAVSLCEPQTSSGVFASHDLEDLARQPLAALVRTGIRNDFEQVVFRQHPLLGTIKRLLLGLSSDTAGEVADVSASGQALYAALSGSGSVLFGLYGDSRSAGESEARLAAIGVKSMRTRMVSRAEYWEQMIVS